ncbi:MAG: hypothetical protein PUK70_07445 [Bacteroidales bacterium]|nr:hypothetical protein [Bacteroidales bacterium]MDY6002220.1 phage/plasmid replication protein [Candidatus Cryptobacteroides sp.]
MYDTVFLRLTQAEVNGVDFLEEVPCFLEDVGEHIYSGFPFITGNLNGLKVTANRYQLKVKDGSLCKYLLGDNFQTMGRGDTQRAIEKLSDTLHLPMGKAVVTRMDIAQNFIVKHPPQVYLNHLGALRYANRLQEPSGLYYSLNGGRLCFYDKNKEQKSKREEIPDLYNGRNVLRYERRYTQRIAAKFGVAEVTGAMLYDEAFYIEALNRWKADYQAIQKINDITLNFQAMKTKQELYKMGILSLTEQAGGQVEMINQINEAQQRGELTKKQAYDLRVAVNEACQLKEGLTAPNEAIQELDKKVAEAVRFYR